MIMSDKRHVRFWLELFFFPSLIIWGCISSHCRTWLLQQVTCKDMYTSLYVLKISFFILGLDSFFMDISQHFLTFSWHLLTIKQHTRPLFPIKNTRLFTTTNMYEIFLNNLSCAWSWFFNDCISYHFYHSRFQGYPSSSRMIPLIFLWAFQN